MFVLIVEPVFVRDVVKGCLDKEMIGVIKIIKYTPLQKKGHLRFLYFSFIA